MRHRYHRITSILQHLGGLLQVSALVMLFPLLLVIGCWLSAGEGWHTLMAFMWPSLASLTLGTLLKRLLPDSPLDATGSLLFCALGWIVVGAFGLLTG